MSFPGLGRVKTLVGEGQDGSSRDVQHFRGCLCPDSGYQRLSIDDVHHSGEVVSQNVERHFAGDFGQAFHQEVRRSYSHLKSAEGMFDRLPALAHGLGVPVEPLLHRLQHMLVLPPRDPPFLAGCAARFKRTVTADVGPIAP